MKAQYVPFLTYYGDSCRLCGTGGCSTAISINHQLLHLQEEMRFQSPRKPSNISPLSQALQKIPDGILLTMASLIREVSLLFSLTWMK